MYLELIAFRPKTIVAVHRFSSQPATCILTDEVESGAAAQATTRWCGCLGGCACAVWIHAVENLWKHIKIYEDKENVQKNIHAYMYGAHGAHGPHGPTRPTAAAPPRSPTTSRPPRPHGPGAAAQATTRKYVWYSRLKIPERHFNLHTDAGIN